MFDKLDTADVKARKVVIRQRERQAFWWTRKFVSVELFKVKNYAKTRNVFKSDSYTLGHGNSHGKSWNLKRSKVYEPIKWVYL